MPRSPRAYGSWPSPILAPRIASGSLRLSQPQIDRGRVYWLEGRPDEGGRQRVMVADGPGDVRELTPRDVNVRTRVHEYGGGDYLAHSGRVFFSRFDDGRIYVQPSTGGPPEPVGEAGSRHADFALSPDGRWLVAVEERDREGDEPSNRLLAIPLSGGPARRFAEGFDFVSDPRFAPDGRTLVHAAWRHPQMPWDATTLHVVDWEQAGPGATRQVAGGGNESIFQPGFCPDGVLTFVSDRSGWWNLEQLRDGERVALCPRTEEFGRPQWRFALSTWDAVDADTLLCCRVSGGRDRIARLDLVSGALEDLELPFDAVDGLRVEGRSACFIGAGPQRAGALVKLDLESGRFDILRESVAPSVDPGFVSVPEAVVIPTHDGERTHALVYRPVHPNVAGEPGSRPPLLVKSHGGPTGATRAVLDLRIQYWTSRGFCVVDVDYRGSTGYGRTYRDRLRGEWGVLDVADCVDAARFAAAEGLADGERLAISGGSAGGYTTLCALTFHDLFGAGASHYGIGDLEALARDTHKFESRYLDGLIGPYPECRDLYRARSPIHHTERLRCPVIFFQGLEDRVVPPAQAEAMVAALASRGIPHAYVSFEGEQHGFRRAENVAAALEGELWFYAQVFGFEVDVEPDIELQFPAAGPCGP